MGFKMKTKLRILIAIIILAPSMVMAQYQDEILSVRPELEEINPNRVDELSSHIDHLSEKYYVDPYLILSIIKVETHFRNVTGDKNLDVPACGYMQIRPDTFRRVMSYSTTCDRLIYDWKMAMEASVKYIDHLRDEHGKILAISKYNGGFENLDYVYKVLRAYHQFKGDIK